MDVHVHTQICVQVSGHVFVTSVIKIDLIVSRATDDETCTQYVHVCVELFIGVCIMQLPIIAHLQDDNAWEWEKLFAEVSSDIQAVWERQREQPPSEQEDKTEPVPS